MQELVKDVRPEPSLNSNNEIKASGGAVGAAVEFGRVWKQYFQRFKANNICVRDFGAWARGCRVLYNLLFFEIKCFYFHLDLLCAVNLSRKSNNKHRVCEDIVLIIYWYRADIGGFIVIDKWIKPFLLLYHRLHLLPVLLPAVWTTSLISLLTLFSHSSLKWNTWTFTRMRRYSSHSEQRSALWNAP